MEPSAIKSAIVQELQKRDRLSFEDLLRLLPTCTWNQMIAAVDRLSRDRILTLRHPDRLTYLVSLTPQRTSASADSRLAPR
ncbi:MAG: hypothetical protein ACREI2_12850 [Nitrospiraceae bacterium]